jgi:FSR family fosmidomycin resistance protein-like MFS transporter
VPALLPFLISARGYSYAAAAALVLASNVGSSVIQPLFGLLSDRFSVPWLIPAGILLAGVGISLVGVAGSYALTVAAVAASGLGVAAFHPEGARFANYAARGQRATGMSLFSIGGNAGFALGPALTTPLVLAFGLRGTLGLVLLPAVVAGALAAELPRLRRLRPKPEAGSVVAATRPRDEPGAFARLGGVITLRSGVYFGLGAFVPLWFAAHLGTSKASGNTALTIMLAAGAVGTYVGGRITDRVGRRVVLRGSMAALAPLLVLFLACGPLAATAVLAAIGFVTIASFSLTVVMGQEYLPSRIGLASGVTLGLAIGTGGLFATGLGVLADHAGLPAVMWTIAALPVPALALALTLPPTSHERARAAAAAAAAPARRAEPEPVREPEPAAEPARR